MSLRSRLFCSITCCVALATPIASTCAQEGGNGLGLKPAAVQTQLGNEELMKKVSLLLVYNQLGQMKAQLEADGFVLDKEMALEGARRVISGEEVGIPMEEITSVMSQMRDKVQEMQKKKQAEMMAKMKKMAEENKLEGEKYLAENAKKDGVKTLEGGVQYEVMVEGTGPKPKPTDQVSINYHGTFVDGTVFDSTVTPPSGRPAKPYQGSASGFVKGFNAAIAAMPVGSKWKVSIPSDLAYGLGGRGMEPNKTLIFELELLEIVPKSDSDSGAQTGQ